MKKKQIKEQPEARKPNPPIERPITETLETNYMPYAMSVIISRAIPQIDGFKPSHRKLLYTMYKMGLLTGQRIKSLDVVGRTMSLNPHGDAAIYETLVRLTRGNGALLHPLIDSKGNFARQFSRDMAYAAARYTEVKLDHVCEELFKDIDKDTVDFIENYNGTTTEPVLLPVSFPNVLVTPTQGIAVGMASSVPSFNLADICKAAIAVIKDKNADVLSIVKAPDFPSGGELLYNEKDMESIFKTGRGSFKLRGRYRYDKKHSLIEIYEIPYTTTTEAIIEKIITLVKQGKLRDVLDVRDETGLSGLKIAVDIKKSADPDVIMKRIFAMTPLIDSFSCNFNILIDGKPRVMGVSEILEEWLVFRIDCVSRRLRYDIAKNSERIHLLSGLRNILVDIDKAIKIIRETENEKDVITNLMHGFAIDEIQAEYIAEIRLRNINREYLLKRVSELQSLRDEVARLEGVLNDGKKLNAIIIDELNAVCKKYGKPRVTEIVFDDEPIKPTADEFIDDYPVKLYLTQHMYFKKIPLVSLRSAQEQNLKDDDEITVTLDASNKWDVLFFSDRQNVYKMKVSDIPDQKAGSLGVYAPNLLNLPEDERIIYIASTQDYSGHILFCYENGKMAKVLMSSYQTKMNRRKLVNAFSDKSRLVFAAQINGEADFIAFRNNDRALLFNTGLIAEFSAKKTVGVQVYKLRKNDVLSKVMPKEAYQADDIEYYRARKLPSSGHFIIDNQLKLSLDFKE